MTRCTHVAKVASPRCALAGCRERSRRRLRPRASIPDASHIVLLAGSIRSRVPPGGGAMLTLLRVPFNRSWRWRIVIAPLRLIRRFSFFGFHFVFLRGAAPRARKASQHGTPHPPVSPEEGSLGRSLGVPRSEPPCTCYPRSRRRAGLQQRLQPTPKEASNEKHLSGNHRSDRFRVGERRSALAPALERRAHAGACRSAA